MTTITVLENPGCPGPSFRAVANGVEGAGAAPGEALDALLAQTGRPTGAVILLKPPGSDEFFPAAKRDRLTELMSRWRATRDAGAELPPPEQSELEALVDEEMDATIERSAAWLRAARS